MLTLNPPIKWPKVPHSISGGRVPPVPMLCSFRPYETWSTPILEKTNPVLYQQFWKKPLQHFLGLPFHQGHRVPSARYWINAKHFSTNFVPKRTIVNLQKFEPSQPLTTEHILHFSRFWALKPSIHRARSPFCRVLSFSPAPTTLRQQVLHLLALSVKSFSSSFSIHRDHSTNINEVSENFAIRPPKCWCFHHDHRSCCKVLTEWDFRPGELIP